MIDRQGNQLLPILCGPCWNKLAREKLHEAIADGTTAERERIVKLIQSLYRRLPAVKPAEVSDGIWQKSLEAAEEFNGAIDEVLAAIESTVSGETNAVTD